jgi:hypothetical protein
LDQLDDVARPEERIHVYRLQGPVSHGIACSRGKHGGCRQITMAHYEYHATQPEDSVLRETEKWAEWTAEQWKAQGEKPHWEEECPTEAT